MKVLPINSYENKYFNVHNKKAIDYAQNPFVQREEISFKALPLVDFARGVKNAYPSKEIVNKDIGRGILYRKLLKADKRILQNYDLSKLLESLPVITPQGIAALVRVLELRLIGCNHWTLSQQMEPFYKRSEDMNGENKFVFDIEKYNAFNKIATEDALKPGAKYTFNMDKYLSLLKYAEDKNGFHPEVIKFVRYDDWDDDNLKFFDISKSHTNMVYNIDLINYVQDLINPEDYSLSEDLLREIKDVCLDKNGDCDKEAMDFYKEKFKEEDSYYMPRVAKFINILEEDGKFQSQYKDYYEKINTSHQYNLFPEIWNYKLNHPKEDIIPALDKAVEISDYIQKNKPNNYPQIQEYLSFLLENNNFEKFKEIYQSYGKHLTIKQICIIIETCSNKEGKVEPRSLVVAEEIFTQLKENDKDLVSYTLEQEALFKLLKAITNENGRVDSYKYKLVKENHNKPYPAYILTNFLDGKGSYFATIDFPKTLDYFTQFIEKYGDDVEVAEGYDKRYFLAQKCKEYFWYTGFNEDKKAIVDKYMPVFGVDFCDKFLNDYKIKEAGSLNQIAEIAELMKNNKQKLKNYNQDIDDEKIFNYLLSENRECVNFYNSVGKSIFQEAFNLKFVKFRKFVRFFDKNIDTYNRFLIEKIDPQNSERFKNFETKLKKEKNKLRLALTPKQRDSIEVNKAKIKELEANITNENKKQTLQEIKTLKKEIQSVYKSLKLKPYIDKINKYSAEKNQLLVNAIKDPAKALELIDSVLKLFEIITNDELKEYIKIASKNNGHNQKELNEYVNKLVFKYNGIAYSEELSNKLNFTKNKYLPKLLANTNDECKENLIKLCQIVERDKTNNNKAMFDALEQNIKTKKIFKKHKIIYDKWTGYDPNSNIILQSSMDYNAMKEAAIRNLEVDLADGYWEKIPQKEVDKIHKALKEKGYEISDKIFRKDTYLTYQPTGEDGCTELKKVPKLTKNGEVIEFEDLAKIISVIKRVFNKEDFWNMKSKDVKVNEARETLITHIAKMRYNEAQNISNKNIDTSIKIQKTDMNDIGHALFLGNHASCCTAIGSGSNSWTAPLYIMNKCVQSIEVVDGEDFVGNTMIFLTKVDGKLALLLDNIELKLGYQYNNKIRDAIFEYAEKLCAEIGQPDIPIYAGSLRHKVNMGKFDCADHKVEILGKSEQPIYVDSISDHQIGNKKFDVSLYKIK